MCGITGLFSKSPTVAERLGELLALMLVEMQARGGDSTGAAIYADPLPPGSCRVSLRAERPSAGWDAVERQLSEAFRGANATRLQGEHASFTLGAEPEAARSWIVANLPEVDLLSVGRALEIYKDATGADAFVERFGIASTSGTHALGHTRMATESRVSARGAHPFSTGPDLCLVHNGSLSNHNRLRRDLRGEGIEIRTENDSEVAAGYLTWRMREGASIEQALEGCLEDLDGFYTFAVGTLDGFAVLRDPIACKPAVMAETDDWVAIASEYRALAVLPGASEAKVWEPERGRVYSWGRAVLA
ncbi:MAG: class II glutamine amidotransferase domain-containing protein [Solirubrobacteraceae bacterium]